MAPHDMAGQNALLYHPSPLRHKAWLAAGGQKGVPSNKFWLIT